MGVGKYCHFRLKSPSISETVIGALSNGDIFNDLHGPLTRFQGHNYLEKRRVLGTKLLLVTMTDIYKRRAV